MSAKLLLDLFVRSYANRTGDGFKQQLVGNGTILDVWQAFKDHLLCRAYRSFGSQYILLPSTTYTFRLAHAKGYEACVFYLAKRDVYCRIQCELLDLLPDLALGLKEMGFAQISQESQLPKSVISCPLTNMADTYKYRLKKNGKIKRQLFLREKNLAFTFGHIHKQLSVPVKPLLKFTESTMPSYSSTEFYHDTYMVYPLDFEFSMEKMEEFVSYRQHDIVLRLHDSLDGERVKEYLVGLGFEKVRKLIRVNQ